MSQDPTHRLPAARPPARRDIAYVQSDEALWREYVGDRLRSLTTGVTLVAIVAAAALGVGLWALLADPRDQAPSDRMQRLEGRVERLDAALDQRPAAGDLAGVREQQQSLDQRLRALEEQLDEPSDETQAMIEAIESTQQAIAQLEDRVASLEQSAPAP
jgi:septal ring factor EnvC (AmiA/AmiB activator)